MYSSLECPFCYCRDGGLGKPNVAFSQVQKYYFKPLRSIASHIFTVPVLSSVQFSHSVVSNFWRPHGLQHARPLCPSPTPSLFKLISIVLVMPSNQLIILCHCFSSCLQSFPASGSFPMSQLFASGGQSIGVSASASVLPMNTQD